MLDDQQKYIIICQCPVGPITHSILKDSLGGAGSCVRSLMMQKYNRMLRYNITKIIPCSNYIYNIPDDDLIRSKHIEETSIIHDKVAHHQFKNVTRSFTSKTSPVN
jgi:hypothetical protein